MNLGENIYRLRTEKNMSQGDLADALEVSRQSVSKWENNSAVPELEKLVKMADIFGVTLDKLVNGTDAAVTQDPPPQQNRALTVKEIISIILIAFGILIFCLSLTLPHMDPENGIYYALLLATTGICVIRPLRHISNLLIFPLDAFFLLACGASPDAAFIFSIPFLLMFIIQCYRALKP